jgi:transcriptional regulator with XRE-family HTH domain
MQSRWKKSIYTREHRRLLRRLRGARKEAGLSQADVARALGCAQALVSKVETGQRRLDVVELIRFAKLYGKPLSYFVEV